jgi:O-antigen ligase
MDRSKKNKFYYLIEWLFLLPFFSIVFYGFGDIRINLLIYFFAVFSFCYYIFFLENGFEIYFPKGYHYFFTAVIISSISFIFSPIKHLIIIDYIGFLLGFVIFFLMLQKRSEDKIIYLYPFLFIIAIYSIYTGIVNKGEFTSTLKNVNTLAFVSILICGMMLEEKKYYLALFFLIIIILTKSIAALIAIMLTSFYYSFINRRNIDLKKNYFILIIVGVIFAFLIYHIDFNSVYDRIRWWKYSLDMFLEKPISGWGYSSFAYISERYLSMELKSIYAHNYFLEILSDFGILFFIFWMIFLYFIIKSTSGFYHYAIVASLIHSFFDFGLNTICGWWLFLYVSSKAIKNNLFVFRITEKYLEIKPFIRILAFSILISFLLFAIKYVDLYNKNKDIIDKIEKKDYEIALSICNDTLKKYPSSIDIALRKYEIYTLYFNEKGDYKYLYSASNALEYILVLNPYSKRIYQILDELYRDLGDEKSLNDLSKRKKNYLKSI